MSLSKRLWRLSATTAELGNFTGTFTSTGTVCYGKTYVKTVPDRDGIVRCPLCAMKMIKRRTNLVLTSNPLQYPWEWWCGGCDVYSAGGVDRGKTEEEGWREAWQAENAPQAGK